ncbi:transposase [Streptomyces sp. NPDC000349]|uniref:transposase n=1 Tax=Streptomyces sp. NPDC000349 TaxID=3154249 RepID=UPI00336A575D
MLRCGTRRSGLHRVEARTWATVAFQGVAAASWSLIRWYTAASRTGSFCFWSQYSYMSRCPLSLRPRSGEQVPSLTAQVARSSNPGGTTAIWVRDRLDGLWCDEDFADWYPRDGRPGLSPAQLATVCVLQFLLGLSDRQAAEAVRCRIDFKYAMAMELDNPGFHHSVLADFRDRLAEGDRADRLLDLSLARLKEAGLVRERVTQRTDSTHVLAAVRDLTPTGTDHRGGSRCTGRSRRYLSSSAGRAG